MRNEAEYVGWGNRHGSATGTRTASYRGLKRHIAGSEPTCLKHALARIGIDEVRSALEQQRVVFGYHGTPPVGAGTAIVIVVVHIPVRRFVLVDKVDTVDSCHQRGTPTYLLPP